MYPIVFSEFHQTKRNLPWALLAFLGASALMQYVLGSPAILLFLSPGVAATIGVGTLSEEYSKGQLRFFYSLPVSPLGIWCVKVVSGILGTTLFVAVIWLPAFFIHRPMIELPGSEELGLLIGKLVPVLVGQAILAYAAGLFTISFCQVPNIAILLASLISIIAPLIYALIAVRAGLIMPDATELGLGLAAASLPLWIGAYVLFRYRNPFVDQPWRWRGVAALFGAGQILATFGIAYALTLRPVELTDPYRDGVSYFSVFGEDSKVFVLGSRGIWDVDAYVLDSDGRLARHLFHADQAYIVPEPWREATDSPMILCSQTKVSFKSSGPTHNFLLNLQTGDQTPVTKPQESDRNTRYEYRRVSGDGQSLLGFKEVYDDNLRSYSAFQQNLTTSDIREIPTFKAKDIRAVLFLDDHRVLIEESGSDKPAEGKLTIIDLDSGARTIRQLPSDVHVTFLAPDGRTCAAHLWKFQGDIINQELAVLDVAKGSWKTILTADELPRFTAKEALTGRYPVIMVSYPDHHAPVWMFCTVEAPGGVSTRMLINSRTGARFPLPKKDKGEIDRFSKDGSRFFTLSSLENQSGEERHRFNRLVSVYRLQNSGVELVNSFHFEADRAPQWLGNDRLLYHKRVNLVDDEMPHFKRMMSGLVSGRGELWTVDIQTGQHRRFFAGADSPADH